MNVRLQKANILTPAKYEEGLGSIIVYDENNNPILVAARTVAGTYQFSYLGMSDFGKIFQEITGKKLTEISVTELKESNNGIL